MAVDIDRHRQTCDMGGTGEDADRQRGSLSAEALRTDAQTVDALKKLFFQRDLHLCKTGHGKVLRLQS